MDDDRKWYLLAVVVVISLAIAIPQLLEFPTYSDEDRHEICTEIYSQASLLIAQKADEATWKEFSDTSLEQLNQIAKDIEQHPDQKTAGVAAYYSLSTKELPGFIKSRGRGGDGVVKSLSLAERMENEESGLRSMQKLGGGQSSIDSVVIAILAFDVILAAGAIIWWVKWR
ncbi:hypothetical protein [Blastopirellula marina]|uniref:Uncharacterized protein n=1 Tax=Blastopirellula marina TaxID=124 RepID=A0A2S8GMB1_9BACT|nr:hypothetical protein [Blastopirellula marina]PQO45481.1 hypothetical protein C5Y93_13600 [Blastopirellula marina]